MSKKRSCSLPQSGMACGGISVALEQREQTLMLEVDLKNYGLLVEAVALLKFSQWTKSLFSRLATMMTIS